MKTVIKEWFYRYFSEPEAGILFSMIVFGLLLIMLFNNILAPVFASIVIAYLLDWGVNSLQRIKCPHGVAVVIVFIVFVALVILLFLGLVPLLTKQLNNLVTEMPKAVVRIQGLLTDLPKHLSFIGSMQIDSFVKSLQSKLGHFGQTVLSFSFTLIPNLVTFVVYLVMVPMLVYFFLMDKKQIFSWISDRFIPKKRTVLNKVWAEVHIQIGNYVRGKVLEAIIVGIISFITFASMGLQYSLLLGAVVGLSVFIPYIGAIVVTIPVVIVAILQWGVGSHFWWLMLAYAIIIAVDANILVPLLFSEAVSLHPVAIIVAVLIFGAFWGFGGIFFAIPLAALVKAIIVNWPIAHNR
jgi:putative permease